MSDSGIREAVDGPAGADRFPLLLALLLASGAASLVYEVVWFQLLTLTIGSSSISLGILLASFMGGMCAGSLLLPRLVSARRHPLRVYAVLELGIGALGLLALLVIPVVGRLYLAAVGYGAPGVLLRGLACALCLLLPTALMGATLPAVARAFGTDRDGISRTGLLYAANLVGAVAGCLAAGFWLLRVHDVMFATLTAAGLNVVAGVGALLLSRRPFPSGSPPDGRPVPAGAGAARARLVIALSGFTALAAEVVWTRQLSLLLGASVYTFALILGVFLAGLGLGGAAGAGLARRTRSPAAALGAAQLLLGLGIGWAAFTITRALPAWPVDPALSTSPWAVFQLDLVRAGLAVMPAALLWGMSFPLALAVAAPEGGDAGRHVAGVYAANTVGAIAGSLAAGLFLIGGIGTRGTQQGLVGVSLVAAILALAGARSLAGRRLAGVVALGGLTVWCAVALPGPPPGLIAFGRYVGTWDEPPEYVFVGEGRTASVAVTRPPDGFLHFHVSGKIVASSRPRDMRLQGMLGHLPALAHPDPKDVLVVGCGAGVTAGTLGTHPDVERIVLCEIEPLVTEAAARYFGKENHGVVRDERTELILDDARHYVFTTDQRFDIVTSDPIHPWVRGAASLYTKEYFERCREILKPGGIVTQWLPLYETTEETVRSAMATFFAVFPEATVWTNRLRGEGWDLVLMGSNGPVVMDMAAMKRRLRSEEYGLVRETFEPLDLGTAFDVVSCYVGRAPDLAPWLAGTELNRDRNLRLQYLAGLGLYRYESRKIYERIVEYRTYPEDLIRGAGFDGALLRKLLD